MTPTPSRPVIDISRPDDRPATEIEPAWGAGRHTGDVL